MHALTIKTASSFNILNALMLIITIIIAVVFGFSVCHKVLVFAFYNVVVFRCRYGLVGVAVQVFRR